MKKHLFIILSLSLAFLFLTSCDRTRLEGEIIVLQENIKAGDEVSLVLNVPDKLKGIYRTMWTVENQGTGEIDIDVQILQGEALQDRYTIEQLKEIFNTEEINYDRVAIFIPENAGKYTVYVEGFFKQTNPQPISSLEIDVQD